MFRFFQRRSVRWRIGIFALCSVVTCLLAALSGAGLVQWSATKNREIMTEVSQSYQNNLAAINRLAIAQNELASLIRQTDPDAIEQGMAHYEAAWKETATLVQQVGVASDALQMGSEASKAVLQKVLSGNNGGAMELYVKTYGPAVEEMFRAVRARSTEDAKLAQEKQVTQERQTIRVLWLAAGGLFVGIASIVFWGWYFQWSISRELDTVTSSLATTTEIVEVSSKQLKKTGTKLAEGASEQAASIEETSASLEELASMTKRNTENSQKVNELAKQANSAADTGVSDMRQMRTAMDAIKASSDDIAKIIKTIDEIAFQTNILALNAAVEAARAGDAGLGFAVVADEVRALARRSALASKETAAKIEAAIANSGQGVQVSGKVAQSLNEIALKARQVVELAAEVANASREQSQGIGQINLAVGQMDKVTQSNAAEAEESASAAEELSAQAERMKASVAELQSLVEGHQAVVGRQAAQRTPIPAAATIKPPALAEAVQFGNHRNGDGNPVPPLEAPARSGLAATRDFSQSR